MIYVRTEHPSARIEFTNVFNLNLNLKLEFECGLTHLQVDALLLEEARYDHGAQRMDPVKLPVRVPPCVRVEIDEDLHSPRHLRRWPHRLCEVGGPKPMYKYIYILVFVMGLLIIFQCRL